MPGDADKEAKSQMLQGLTAVDETDVQNFLREMNDTVIPEILKIVEERRLQAAESRQWQLKC